MKATKLLSLLILSSFLVVGCDNPFKKKEKEPENNQQEPSNQDGGNSGENLPPQEEIPFHKKVTIKMEALLKGSDTPYNVEFDYDDSYFVKDANNYDKDLALLSFGAAISATYKDWVLDFFSDTEFMDSYTHDLDQEPTEDSLGYAFAHKPINDFELFVVALRGHEYKKEWSNNSIIGEEGDHNGFLDKSTGLYNDLNSYISSKNTSNKPIKIWMMGYSRGGAIANTVSSLILRGDEINVEAKDLFTYTFEAPASLTEEHAVAYQNVHNVVNSADLVTYIPPTHYGLYRCGTNCEIYDADVATIIKEFDEEINIPNFTYCNPSDFGGQTITNDIEFTRYLVNDIFSNKGDDSVSAHTRALYVANYQSGLSYSIGLMLALKGTTRSQMISDLTGSPLNALIIMSDSTGTQLANFFKTYLNMDGISYVDADLLSACATLIKAMQNLFTKILGFYMGGTNQGNFTRTIDMHYPEVTYVLLKNAHSKLAA